MDFCMPWIKEESAHACLLGREKIKERDMKCMDKHDIMHA
jgi:hypothetical protein